MALLRPAKSLVNKYITLKAKSQADRQVTVGLDHCNTLTYVCQTARLPACQRPPEAANQAKSMIRKSMRIGGLAPAHTKNKYDVYVIPGFQRVS